jgi:hypothetical protein
MCQISAATGVGLNFDDRKTKPFRNPIVMKRGHHPLFDLERSQSGKPQEGNFVFSRTAPQYGDMVSTLAEALLGVIKQRRLHASTSP